MSTAQCYQDRELPGTADPRRYDDLVAELLEGPYWIADILPEQVNADDAGQYFAVERYFRQPPRIVALRRKYAEILLRLNCYFDMGNGFLRAVFLQQNAMLDYDHNDTYLTVYDPDAELLDKVRALAAAEGLFLWSPPRKEG